MAAFAVLFYWNADRVRRRERAINAILENGGAIYYGDHMEAKDGDAVRFWHHLLNRPVNVVYQRFPFDSAIGQQIVNAKPIHLLAIMGHFDDAGSEWLYGLNGGCELTIYGPELITTEGIAKFEKRMPRVKIKVDSGPWGF